MKKKQIDNNEEMADLFENDLKKIKRAKYNDMDDTFTYEEKKHHHYFFIIILLLLVAGCCYYYFIIDSPKTVYSYISKEIVNNIRLFDNNKSIKYDLTIDGEGKNNKVFNILNKMSFSGSIGKSQNANILSGSIDYNSKRLLDYDILMNNSNDDNIYLKLDNITARIIKIEPSIQQKAKHDLNIANYEYVTNTVINAFSDSIDNANYQKTITKENDEYLKVMTLKINSSFINNFINKLIKDDKFITSYSSLTNKTKEEVINELKKYKTESKNINDTISIYLSIFSNDFYKLEYNGTGTSILITKNGNKYNYEIAKDYNKTAEGYFKIKGNRIVINYQNIDTKTNIDIDLNYSIKDNNTLKEIDYKKAISYKDLDTLDIKEIENNVNKNEALKSLFKDLGINAITTYINKN